MNTKTTTFEQAAVDFLLRVLTDLGEPNILHSTERIVSEAFRVAKDYASRGEVPADFQEKFTAYARRQGVSLDDQE